MTSKILKGRYQIKRHLGKRAGQRTLLAWDQQSQKFVVVKLLTFSSDLTWETFRLFEREAKTLRKLSHPAIPGYLDYFEIQTDHGKGFALVQSYINAPSLEEYLKAGRIFSETNLKQIAKAVLEILIYLHNCHPAIIHRDIKPGNILLTNRSGAHVEQVYLVDFGSVQAAAVEQGTITVVGTYGYMPPEQFGGRAVAASDLYSLGATLIYLASGQHPADFPQKDLRICFENYVSLSPSFIDWLQWMTQPSLERRLASASQALQVLENPQPQHHQSLILKKPAGSKVVLTKNHDFIQIFMPSQCSSIELLWIVGFAISWNVGFFMNFLKAIRNWSSGGWIEAFFLLVPLGIGLGIILCILFCLFGGVELKIDHHKISLKYKIFGCEYQRPRPATRHKIFKLKYKKNTESTFGELMIFAGRKTFTLGDNCSLSPTEIDWLADELSNWLKLPISQDNQII